MMVPLSVAPTNLDLARRYLSAMESGTLDEKLAFFASDIEQVEFPNLITPKTVVRDLAALRASAERGRDLMQAERYEILHALAEEQTVALEVQWTGTLAVPVGKTPAGGTLRARLAIFLEFRDGKIIRQRNYDCFDPW